MIHQVWISHEEPNVPQAYTAYWDGSWQRLNPSRPYKLWRLSECEGLLRQHYPQYMHLWHRLKSNIEKADFIRYLIIYHHGGLYVDLDVGAKTVLEDVIDLKQPYTVYPEWLDRKDRELSVCYSNMLFYCRDPKSDLMARVLCEIRRAYSNLEKHQAYIQRTYTKRPLKLGELLYHTTGPRIFTRTILKLQLKPCVLGMNDVERHSIAYWKRDLSALRQSYSRVHNNKTTWKVNRVT